MVSYKTAIKKPFTDGGKLFVGTLLSIVPVLRWFAKGFILESSGVGKHKDTKKMPEWDSWGDFFVKGLLSTIINVIYALPAVLFFLIATGFAAASFAKTVLAETTPAQIMAFIGSGKTGIDAIKPVIVPHWSLFVQTLFSMIPLLIVTAVLALIAAYLLPVAVLHYIKSGKFESAFKLGPIFKRALTGEYFITWVAVAIISAILMGALLFVPIIGFAFGFFLSGIIGYSLFGQVLREE